MIENLSNKEVIELAEKSQNSGDYEAARQLLNREMARRGLICLELHAIDMPVAGVED